MTALTIVADAAGRLALTVPSAVFSSTDLQIIQLRALMNQEGKELTSDVDWCVLQTEWTFDTVATAIQVSAIATDFDHVINTTMWDRTTDRPVYGPLNALEWQREKAGPTFTSVYYAFRIRGTSLLLTPTPPVNDAIYYEYVSNLWCTNAAGDTGKTAMTADDDVAKLSEEVITLGVMWRFLKAKGLDFEQAHKDYTDLRDKAIGRDGGKPVLSLSMTMPYRRWQPSILEGGWPGPGNP